MERNKLSELLEKGYQSEQNFIAELSDPERAAVSTSENWNAKDVIAHNSHWRMHHADNLLIALDGKTPTPTEDIDHANQEIYNKYRDTSWEAVEKLAKDSCDRTEEALDALGEQGLQRADLYPWQEGRQLWRFIVGNVYTHPILHLSDWYIRKGDRVRAAGMYREMTDLLADLDNSPDWLGTIRYNLACSYSLLGEKEKAIATLGEALNLNPALTEWSKQDPDFEPIRTEPGYQALYE